MWTYDPLVILEGHVPLQGLVAFELILEAELVVLVGEFEEIEELSARFHDGEWWRLTIVYNDRDAAWKARS